MKKNIVLLTDSYKTSHWLCYRENTQKLFSYVESRGGVFPATLFFGLQYVIKEYLEGKVIDKEKIDEAEAIIAAHMGSKTLFNRKGWEYILRRHDGRLPIKINAVPEGTLVPTSNVLVTIENTDIEVPWLTNYLETILLQSVWYGTTVATQSFFIKRLIKKYLMETGGVEGLDFKLHDFGFRGVSSVESAGLGGLAHLVNFKGTDTMAALTVARDYYGEKMAGFSIPAAEHSTICSWGRENETQAFQNMLEQFPTGLVAVVSDSYDIFEACKNKWGKELKDKVLKRDGTLVIRPDSGDPATVVLKVLEILGEAFGTTVNQQGYKELNPKVRVIQGDGVNITSIDKILNNMKLKKWSAANLAFGMGGALLQRLDRDTQKMAFKASQVVIDSIPHDVYKAPVTDQGKASKKGRLALVRAENGDILTVPEASTQGMESLLRPVFWDGDLMVEDSLATIRARADSYLDSVKTLAKA